MDKKICTKCNIEKDINCFGKDKYSKQGYTSACKDCRNQYSKKYHKENSDNIHKRKNDYYNNTEEGKEYRKKYSKKRYKEEKENILLHNKIWRNNNREYRKEYLKDYSSKNRDKINSYDRKRRENIKVRLDENFSRSIYSSLKKVGSSKKEIGWEKAVGYTTQQLIEHLQLKFKPEMSWENYGSYWHIDHIVPKSWFVYTSIEDEQFKKCWSLENLQPLEASENLKKGNRYAG